VAVVNPLRSRLFAEARGTLAKTDRVDARMLALLGEALTPQARPIAPEVIEALQELVHAHSAATADRRDCQEFRA
jgi:transposase